MMMTGFSGSGHHGKRLTRLAFAARLFAAPVLLVVAAHSTHAATFGFHYKSGSNFDGIKGSQQIRTDPPTILGIGYVHATQALRSADPDDPDFVAVGTTIGDRCAWHLLCRPLRRSLGDLCRLDSRGDLHL